MGVGLYLFIAFFVFFFTYKLKEKSFKKEGNTESKWTTVHWVERPSFWFILLVPLLWFITIPMLVMWRVLEIITAKYFNKFK
jgi:hypothetical protein